MTKIRPALISLGYKGVPSSKDSALVQRVAEHNVQDYVTHLARAPTLASLVKANQPKVDAMHHIATGRIRWLA